MVGKESGRRGRRSLIAIVVLVASFGFGLVSWTTLPDVGSGPRRRMLAQSDLHKEPTNMGSGGSAKSLLPIKLVWAVDMEAQAAALEAARKAADKAEARLQEMEASSAKLTQELKQEQQRAKEQEVLAAKAAAQAKELETASSQVQQRVQELESAAAKARYAGRIPKILHHVFIVDPTNPAVAGLKMWPHHEKWVEACKRHHSPAAGWTYMYWDWESSERLVAEHYPAFLDFYKTNVTLANEKSDMIRYLVLHKFGGLYLDSDSDCWRESGDTLEGYDVVLQGTHDGEGVGSAAIASIPGAPVWVKALDMVQNRNVGTLDGHPEWYRSLEFTGPNLLRDSLKAVGLVADEKQLFPEMTTTTDGLVYRVNRANTWFLACQWFEPDCRKRVYEERALGQTDLSVVVGMHRFSGSWIAGKEDGKRVVTCTEA